MEGIGQAASLIADLARASVRSSILDVKGEPAGVYYLVGPDGKAERKMAEPNWHGEELDTPEELRRYVEDIHSKRNPEKPEGVVFFDEDRIVYAYDRHDRRDRATCKLKLSPQYLWLRDGSSNQMRQTDFIRLLRITLRGCLTNGNLLALVRQLKFNNAAAADTSIQHGKESIGRQITAAVTGTDALPEETDLIIPVFENFNAKVKVACAIEIFAQEGTFRLSPYPLEMKLAMDETMRALAALFDDEADLPPSYRGQP